LCILFIAFAVSGCLSITCLVIVFTMSSHVAPAAAAGKGARDPLRPIVSGSFAVPRGTRPLLLRFGLAQ
jgi:hypothetical protein